MNELRRMAYLEALGIDSYVSRTQMPGAALTRRLAIVSAPTVIDPVMTSAASAATIAPDKQAVGRARDLHPSEPHLRSAVAVPVATGSLSRSVAVPRFSLTAIVAGQWLWLEELGGMPLTKEQVQLVQSMAQALLLHRESRTAVAMSATRSQMAQPNVSQFDWPIHTNHQLDLGTQAAQASVAGFVSRRLEQHGCRGLVLLGEACALRVPSNEVKFLTVQTASSAQILAQPTLKPSVWRDLLPLVTGL